MKPLTDINQYKVGKYYLTAPEGDDCTHIYKFLGTVITGLKFSFEVNGKSRTQTFDLHSETEYLNRNKVYQITKSQAEAILLLYP